MSYPDPPEFHWPDVLPPAEEVLNNTGMLALSIAGQRPGHASMYMLGLRTGLAMALLRPEMSNMYIQAMRQGSIGRSPVTIQELCEFELQCVAKIYGVKNIDYIPSLLEPN